MLQVADHKSKPETASDSVSRAGPRPSPRRPTTSARTFIPHTGGAPTEAGRFASAPAPASAPRPAIAPAPVRRGASGIFAFARRPAPLRPPYGWLELRLGDSSAPAKGTFTTVLTSAHAGNREGHELVLELGTGTSKRDEQDNQKTHLQLEEDDEAHSRSESPVGLSLSCHLLPAVADTGSVNSEVSVQGFDVNNVALDEGAGKMRSLSASASSLQVEVPLHQAADHEVAEDEEMNGGVGGVRKKLRLSKEQSAFLEDSFKEHSTLTPDQKSDLARLLNLRPRQVEVWFQNRRARTKLKQTEVDCEYLKRCCATLTQENRRLQREVAELRALRTTYPFYGQPAGFSATRGCPSCDNKAAPPYPVVTSLSSSLVASPPSSMSTLFGRPYLGPTFTVHPVLRRHPSATS